MYIAAHNRIVLGRAVRDVTTRDAGCAGYLTLNASATANYTFRLGSDDASYLVIDGTMIINNQGVPLSSPWSSLSSVC